MYELEEGEGGEGNLDFLTCKEKRKNRKGPQISSANRESTKLKASQIFLISRPSANVATCGFSI
jgi:hypothetical protein